MLATLQDLQKPCPDVYPAAFLGFWCNNSLSLLLNSHCYNGLGETHVVFRPCHIGAVTFVVITRMSENVPPASAGKTGTTSDRGLPYYEKLRRDLRDTINEKRILDRNMAAIETEIFRQETSYLEDTSSAGNIVKGFDNYIKAAATTTASSLTSGTISGSAAGGGRRGRGVVHDADRVFSKSSVSYNRDSDSPGVNSAVSTPGGSGTPTGSFAGEGQRDKKKKKSVVNDDDDTRSNKRQKISFSSGRKGHDD